MICNKNPGSDMKWQCNRLIWIGLWIVVLAASPPVRAEEREFRVLCSTFPMYQITRNVIGGQAGVTVSLMLPAMLGCPHDYALTPRDMQKLARADALVINGLGMEAFIGAPVQTANPSLTLVDSSQGITALLSYTEEDDPALNGEPVHSHPDTNPHLFVSPRMNAQLAMNIAGQLSKIDPVRGPEYLKNAQAYAAALNRLADDVATLGKILKNNRIVTQHGVFDYFARDMGLEVVAVVQAHAGQEPSAADMLTIIRTIQQKHAGAVFTEPQYPEKVGRVIAAETGIPATMLDPVATGPENAGLDYYERIMRMNLKVLKDTIGVQ